MNRWWLYVLWLLCVVGWIAAALACFLVFALQGLADTRRPVSIVEMILGALPFFVLLALMTWALVSLWRKSS
jgi:hypothetical protein